MIEQKKCSLIIVDHLHEQSYNLSWRVFVNILKATLRVEMGYQLPRLSLSPTLIFFYQSLLTY
jgi:hypothetical protein